MLWATAFLTLYALSGLGCALGWDQEPLAGLGLFRAMLIGTWVAFIIVHIAWLAVVSRPRFRAREPFWHRLECTVAVMGLVATLWTLFPAGLMTVAACL